MTHRITRSISARSALAGCALTATLVLIPTVAQAATAGVHPTAGSSVEASQVRLPAGPPNSVGPGLHY